MAGLAINVIGLRRYQIMAHATESLDGQQNALAWLQKQSANMGGRTPLAILEIGEPWELQQLDDLLTALDYGMYA